MRHQILQLSEDTVIYGIGEVLEKGVGFLLLPICPSPFMPKEYGTIERLTTVSGFLGALLHLGLAPSEQIFAEQKDGSQVARRCRYSNSPLL